MNRWKNWLAVALVMCMLTACAPAASVPTEPAPETQAATQPVTQPEEEPEPTLAPEEKARELIRDGQYDEAEEILESLEYSEETDYLRMRAHMGDPQVGDLITLGHYEQDGVEENGPEEIQWLVIARTGEQVFLLSVNCLDSQPYHDVIDGTTTWENATIRQWLNEEFLPAALSRVEQKFVLETEVENRDNPNYGTPGGNNTLDRVFLLSEDEVKQYLTEETRLGHVTIYAIEQGGRLNYQGNGWWWLRSPGVYDRDAAYVDATGSLSSYGYIIHRPWWTVRPAMWIDLQV